jgi:hypothetical protein
VGQRSGLTPQALSRREKFNPLALVKVECGIAAQGSDELAEPFAVVSGPTSQTAPGRNE